MSFVISAIQSYSNTAQQMDADSSTQNNAETQMAAIRSLDINAIEKAGPSDATVQSLSSADKKTVLENASNGMKSEFLQAWQSSLDKQTKKEISEQFGLGLD